MKELQLLGRVRLTNEDPECASLKSIQIIQNNLMRTLNRTKVKEKISIRSLLLKFNMLSVNQINASIKLLEIWKSLNEEQHPLKIIQQSKPMEGASTRASVRGRPVETGGSNRLHNIAISDAICIWNKAPALIQESVSQYQVKKAIQIIGNITQLGLNLHS